MNKNIKSWFETCYVCQTRRNAGEKISKKPIQIIPKITGQDCRTVSFKRLPKKYTQYLIKKRR